MRREQVGLLTHYETPWCSHVSQKIGVTVTVRSYDTAVLEARRVETAKEWLSLTEAAELVGMTMDVLRYHIGKGELATYKRDESRRYRKVLPHQWMTLTAGAGGQMG